MSINNHFTYLFFALFLLACAHSHDHASDQAVDEHEEEMDEVGLNLVQMEKIGLELGQFEQKNLSAFLRVNGTLEIPPQNKASVSSLLEGNISRIFVRPGQFIRKGGLLAMLQNPNLIDWQRDLLKTKSELEYLDKEFQRQKDLVEKEIAPAKALEKVRSERSIALAQKKALETRLQLLGIRPDSAGQDFKTGFPIRSPISGYVSKILVTTGAHADWEQPLFDIVDNHHIHIDLRVFEKDLPLLKIGQSIEFSLQSNPNQVMKANIFAIGKTLDEGDRSVTVHAEIPGTVDHLLPGMYVEARIETENLLTKCLPESAIVRDQGLDYIFIQEEIHEDEHHFRKVAVLTGNRDIGYVEVKPLENLADDSQIVLKGAFFLLAQTKKGTADHGHSH